MKRRELLASSLGFAAFAGFPMPMINRRQRKRWAGRDLRGAALIEFDFVDADLRGALLDGADLTRADLRGACLDEARLTNVSFSGARLSGARMRGAKLSGNASYANASGTDLRDARIEDIDFTNADLRDADFRGAHLQGTIELASANLGAANLSHLADPLRKAPGVQALFLMAREANFDRADLTGLFATVCCVGASFREARLVGSCFGYSDTNQQFTPGNWYATGGTDFTKANLTDADLRGGQEEGGAGCPHFADANLTRAKFSFASGYPAELVPFGQLAPFFPGATLTGAAINSENQVGNCVGRTVPLDRTARDVIAPQED